MRDIGDLAGRIDHHKQMIAPVGEHQIIQNPAGVIGQQPIALSSGPKPQHIDRHQAFECQAQRGKIAPGPQDHLPHMADIEQSSLRPAVQMFGHYPRRILHRHLVAREGHHASAQSQMQIM